MKRCKECTELCSFPGVWLALALLHGSVTSPSREPNLRLQERQTYASGVCTCVRVCAPAEQPIRVFGAFLSIDTVLSGFGFRHSERHTFRAVCIAKKLLLHVRLARFLKNTTLKDLDTSSKDLCSVTSIRVTGGPIDHFCASIVDVYWTSALFCYSVGASTRYIQVYNTSTLIFFSFYQI